MAKVAENEVSVWQHHIKPLVECIASLEENDTNKGYYTFARVGCSFGEVGTEGNFKKLLKEAKDLEGQVKESINLECGESISLMKVRGRHIDNVKLSGNLLEQLGLKTEE